MSSAINMMSHNHKYIIKCFPKSGCSTIRNLYINLHWNEMKQYDEKPIETDFHNNYPRETDSVFWDERFKDYKKIIIIRNTYERVVSMFFNRFLDIPDFNCLLYDQTDIYRRRGPRYDVSFDDFLVMLENGDIGGSDEHFSPQNIEAGEPFSHDIIYLNELNEKLPLWYEKELGWDSDKIQEVMDLLNDKKEIAMISGHRKCVGPNVGKMNTYNFKRDPENLQVMNNGIPKKNQMITEDNAKIIYKIYKGEIEEHNFKYEHLL